MSKQPDSNVFHEKSMNVDIKLRPAQPDDVERASVLLYSAYTHRQLIYPLREEGENRFVEHLQFFFPKAENRFSYQYIQVAEQHSEVVGLILSFGGQDEERLNAAIRWRLEREAADDEWYVDALAVFTNWGNKGVGTRLLKAAEQQACQHHYPKIALNVAKENTEAVALYQRLHYIVNSETFLYHQPHVRMVKQLEVGK